MTKIILSVKMGCPSPHKFIESTYKSDITSIATEISSLLPQLSNFISQFNEVVSQTGINVICDSTGSMSIDVPSNMSDMEGNSISKRIGIIDRLITTRTEEINDLIKKGLSLENSLRNKNPNYASELTDKIAEFKRLKDSYKH